MPLDARFSRRRFEALEDASDLCRDLEEVLQGRMQAATDFLAEAYCVRDELNELGHALYSWDESTDFAYWGDDYVSPPSPNRMLVMLRFPDDFHQEFEEPEVEVVFGPWPVREDEGGRA